MKAPAVASVPRAFWIVGIVSLIWNAFGAYDYFMTIARNQSYRAHFPAEMATLVNDFPDAVIVAWAVGAWGAAIGSILLLARNRFAVHAFGLSLLGLVANTGYILALGVPEAMKTPAMTAMTIAVWIIAVFLLLYSIRMRRAGVLR